MRKTSSPRSPEVRPRLEAAVSQLYMPELGLRQALVTVIRSDRRSLSLQLLPDGTLRLRCPRRLSQAAAQQFVKQHIDWVQKQAARLLDPQTVSLPPPDPERQAWLKARTGQRLADFMAGWDGPRPGRWSIRRQRTRWGSCSSSGTISINLHCAELPQPLFEYIVVHELCHLTYLNHGPAFWSLVASLLPDYRHRQRQLARYRLI
ncbi:M48 family metallopeptidase [Oscillospiraceae bacterium HV4-5-C5C]|nr:M48 family metallopeptidase [Oscillospiraceae bacterium HV4-5-C5C]